MNNENDIKDLCVIILELKGQLIKSKDNLIESNSKLKEMQTLLNQFQAENAKLYQENNSLKGIGFETQPLKPFSMEQ